MEVPTSQGPFLDFSQADASPAASCSRGSNPFHVCILPSLLPLSIWFCCSEPGILSPVLFFFF